MMKEIYGFTLLCFILSSCNSFNFCDFDEVNNADSIYKSKFDEYTSNLSDSNTTSINLVINKNNEFEKINLIAISFGVFNNGNNQVYFGELKDTITLKVKNIFFNNSIYYNIYCRVGNKRYCQSKVFKSFFLPPKSYFKQEKYNLGFFFITLNNNKYNFVITPYY